MRGIVDHGAGTVGAVDDGPRIGGLQMLLVIIAITPGYHLVAGIERADGVVDAITSTWFAALVVALCLWGLVALERYARRRAREEEERRRRTAPPDRFVREWEARL
jgi:hypothetical protein